MIQITNRLLANGSQPVGGREPVFQLIPPQGLPTDICMLLSRITDFLFGISIVVAPVFILWAAVLFISAGGNTDQISNAKKILLYVVIGLAVIFLAKGLVLVIQDVLGVSVSGLCGSGPASEGSLPGGGGVRNL